MAKTKIQWAEKTWNPTIGCSRVSAGCDNCYAMHVGRGIEKQGHPAYQGTTRETAKRRPDWTGVVNLVEERLRDPFKWPKPSIIFVDSMSDLFHPAVPDEYIDRVFGVMILSPLHTFQVLTKRPGRMADYILTRDGDYFNAVCAEFMSWDDMPQLDGWPPKNIWLGTSVEGQESADERLPHLLAIPEPWTLFASCEPLLDAVTLSTLNADYLYGWHADVASTWEPIVVNEAIADWRAEPTSVIVDYENALSWVIVGGESGRHARPFLLEWAYKLIAECKKADVPVFVKQLGARPYSTEGEFIQLVDTKGGNFREWPSDLRIREMPEIHQYQPDLF